ncbi:ribonuclease Y [Acholeplasma equirhinis]|uniref:ribonuclease Y n=1 Tax=Acholeplasma equirhinis TaxID=555393 RepID=UPI00197AF562|nr:ribonuclease Y [Acholeplasma equirhinis]MBN3490573.1 ribonuclease Y [Acholeplasma equirhinis]
MFNILLVEESTMLITSILLTVVGLAIGAIVGYFIRVAHHEKSLRLSREEASRIIEDAKKEAEKTKREHVFEAKQEILALRKEFDNDMRERRQVVINLEEKVSQRETSLNQRSQYLDKREEGLDLKEQRLDERKEQLDIQYSKVEELVKEQEAKLVFVSNLTKEQAKELIMAQVRDSISNELAAYIREEEDKAKNTVQQKSKELLALAMQKYASETTSERTVSVVEIPNEDMKGRIIGKEGRNIRTLEALTGVDLIIDDTPEAVVLSGFDPVRREIAKRALSILVQDGRIHPGRIEEVVERARMEIDMFIREAGEEAVFKTAVGKVHPDIIKLLGRMSFRTSYGQNVLKHSIEVAFLAGKLAAEIGENEILARRAGLFHDIGKAVDHEIEGSHVTIGVDIMSRYKEPKEVIDAIASHHGDQEPETIIAVLVAAADALSAARPGARSESMDTYIKRLTQLEEISNGVEGVDKSYAIQAGREVRVIVQPDKIDDLGIVTVARQIKDKIEETMTYPGTIKVTVIREKRATDTAK